MVPQPESDALLSLTRILTTATGTDSLLEALVGPLRALVGAGAAMVVARSAEGPVVRHADGLALPVEELDVPESRGGPLPVDLPAAWVSAGVSHALAQQLPRHLGSVVLAWTGGRDAVPSEVLQTALAVVDLGVARLEAEERLADLGTRVDSAQHLARMGDYDWHIPSDTNRWSDELYRIYGYEPQSFNASYERFLGNIHPDDRERIQAIHERAYTTGEPYQMIERIVRPDGEVRYLSSNGEVIRGSDGVPVRMRGTCIDVTERVLAEQETERAAERFRGLVESSPDAILVLGSDGVVLQANGKAAALLGADPAGHTIEEILPAESSSAVGIEATTLDGRTLVLDVTTAELTESTHEGRTAVFLQDATARLEREAMATRLGEVQQRRRQALEINDNVVQGLTSAVYCLEQEDVRQASSFIERTLAAARNMMDDLLEPSGEVLHAGDLVRSTPATLAQDTPQPEPTSGPDDASGGSAYRVLIVDDAEDIRALLRMKLGRDDRFEVVGEAVDGVDAVAKAQRLRPQLVLLDMAMPRMDGLQALPLIRAAVPGVRVIVLSGFNQSTLEQEALAAGADRYIVKGGSMRELVQTIDQLLQAA
ncbi:MAG TPA: response regulator [Marmoricola sp.]|nr:response regulator [Marmoricola sp.]